MKWMQKFTLITGASSGIGMELTKIAVREKHNVILVARDESKLKTMALECKKAGVKAEYVAVNLIKKNSANTVFEFCQKNKLQVTTLINNAGFGDYGSFASSNRQLQLDMVDLNVRSLTELTHLFLPAMLTEKNGTIMNLGSVASFLPGPLMSVYFATKNYVLSFSRALSEELRGTGVTITCLCPGPTNTGFGKAAHVGDTHATAHPKTTAREVAEFGWYQMQNGTPVAIYGTANRIMIQFTKLIPRNLLTRLVKRFQK